MKGRDCLKILKNIDKFFKKWYNNSPKISNSNKATPQLVKIDTQFFAESDIKKQSSNSLKRALRKYDKRIAQHQAKIENPSMYDADWDKKTVEHQRGLIKHWQKEIRNFQTSIDDRIAELKERGDYDD